MSTFTIRVSSSSTNPAATAFGQQPDQGAPSYFDLVVSGSSDPAVRNGVYDAYCLNPVQTIFVATNYSAEGYAGNSAASFAPIGFSNFSQTHVDQINWLLAQNLTADAKYAGQYNFGEVQVAIWKILGFSDADIASTPAEFLTDNSRNVINLGDADALVAAAQAAVASGNGVVPTDAFFTAIIDPAGNAQPLIVQLQSAKLGNFVWQDSNANGIQDQGEAGVDRVVVELYDGAGHFITSTLTGDDFSTAAVEHGYYQFAGLKAGDYQVKFVAPTYNFTVQDSAAPGATDSNDSDANTLTGLSHVVSLAAGESNQTIDAGLVQKPVDPLPAKLSGYVYEDFGNDGVRGNGEPALAGVTITLTGTNDLGQPVSVVTTTDTNGFYEFTGLRPGTYTVTETQPAAFIDGKDTAGSTGGTVGNDVISQVVLTAGANSQNNNFGELVSASLGDRLWVDANGNGQQDGGEAGVVGATVTLIGGGADGVINGVGDTTATTTTGADGKYAFTGLNVGEQYQVQFTAPAGAVFTTANQGNDASDSDADASTGKTQIVTLASGENNTTLDAGVYTPGSLGDKVFEDKNADGHQDGNEPGIDGVTVRLYNCLTNQLIATQVTANGGLYNFTGLPPGTYHVVFETPNGFVQTVANVGDDASDSDAGVGGKTACYTLSSGQTETTVDAGFYRTASLGDYVWLDNNNNGQQDDGAASGLNGVTVNLRNAVGTVVATTTTANDSNGNPGHYLFTSLIPGDYSVEFVKPAGYSFAKQDQGADGSDSDANTSTGRTITTTLESGENDLSWDAGLVKLASLGDRLWVDANGNGQQDGGEVGVVGATVTLIGGGADGLINGVGDTTATTTTGADGKYAFTGLNVGEQYQVQFSAPAGAVFTTANLGNDASDSDADAGTGKSQIVTLAAGENNTTLDAGVYTKAKLGDFVWEDKNANGVQDAGDLGIAGVQVDLKNTSGAVIATTTTDANGKYSFDVAPGTYGVAFVDPAGYVNTVRDAGGNDAADSDAAFAFFRGNQPISQSGAYTVASGETNLTIDAGYYKKASLGDRVWFDANSNGVQDAGETGRSGVTVNLLNASGTVVATQTTGTDGSYLFSNLTPGSYSVEFVAPSGYRFTSKDAGADAADSDADTISGRTGSYVLSSGESNTTVDAGLVKCLVTLGDRVWLDTNANGVQDSGENGVANVKVTLVGAGADGTLGTADDTQRSTTTDSTGLYKFEGVEHGTYKLRFDTPANHQITAANVGNDDAKDSDVTKVVVKGTTNLITNGSFESGSSGWTGSGDSIEVGHFSTYGVTGATGDNVVELDANKYGTTGFYQDVATTAGQAYQLSVDIAARANTALATNTVEVFWGGVKIATIDPTSTAFKTYSFDVTGSGGNNRLEFREQAGDDDSLGGMIDNVRLVTCTTVTETAPIVVDSCADNLTIDAGLVADKASIGNFLWYDKNANGIQDSGEAGVAGVTVELRDNSGTYGNLVATTTTDANGKYLFSNLNPGDYHIDVQENTLPAGFVFTKPDQGGNDAVDSDVFSTASLPLSYGIMADTTLAAGENDLSWDAGVYKVGIDVEKYVSSTTSTSSNNGCGEGADVAYWKSSCSWQSNLGSYGWSDTGVKYNLSFNSVFGTGMSAGTKSLYDVLCSTGTTAEAVLMRECVAAYLNACHSKVDYAYDKTQVIEQAKWAFGSASNCDITTKSFQAENALGCNWTTSKTSWSSVVDTQLYDADAPPGLEVKTGSTVTFTYIVKNTGDTALKSVLLTDDRITDVKYVSGDTDRDGLLDTNESWTYTAKEVASAGTIKNTGTVTAVDSVGGVATVTDQDDAYYTGTGAAKSSLGDRVWEDKNGNGVQDSGEAGVSGVKVTLLGAGKDGLFGTKDDVTATTTTNANGLYEFKNLDAGKYKLEFEASTGYVFTKQDQAGNDAADSDTNSAGKTGVITLDANEHDLTVDAGIYRKASVGDKVWDDANHNNLQDAGELGIANVTVKLLSATGAVLATTTTNASGNYLFSQLDPGTYQLQFDKTNVQHYNYGQWNNMSNWRWAVKDSGSNDAIDSDVTGNATSTTNVTVTSQFTLDSGESDMTRDAGITPIVIDLNGNGIHTVARADAQGSFDLFGNGKAVASGWLSGDDGFLAVDANGNGKIDGIGELFGGSSKGDGFAKLASFDSNGDGLVNDLDAAFGQLLIWRDANGSHSTDAGELMSLADAGVASLTVAYTELPQLDAQGNLHLERSTATLADGHSVAMTDVYFNVSADDAAAAGVALPTMADLLGNDRSLDSLLGATPQSLGGLKDDDAAAAGAGAGDSAEVLRRLAALSRENCHTSVAA